MIKKYKIKCGSECGKEFEFEEKDIVVFLEHKFVYCPCCEGFLDLEDYNYEEV